MALDLFNARTGTGSRCKWYKAKYVNGNKLVKDAICEGVFYAKDKVAYGESREMVGGMASHRNQRLTIETNDYVGGIEINDYVEISGDLWRVDDIPSIDDFELCKFYTRRPRATTTLVLRK